MSTSLSDKLNLRPQERRLLVVVGIAVFIVINYMFVWSHFGDLGIFQNQKRSATHTLNNMHNTIAEMPQYEIQRNQLRESGQYVPTFQASTLLRDQVLRQALASNVRLGNISPRDSLSASNSFFEEKGLVVTYQAGEEELVNFLYNLGTNESLIRVSEFTVGPDNRLRTELQGRITFVGSFQKTPPARSTSSPTPVNPTPSPPPPATVKTKSSPVAAIPGASTNSAITEPPKTRTTPNARPSRLPPVAASNMGITIPRRNIPGTTNDSPNP